MAMILRVFWLLYAGKMVNTGDAGLRYSVACELEFKAVVELTVMHSCHYKGWNFTGWNINSFVKKKPEGLENCSQLPC